MKKFLALALTLALALALSISVSAVRIVGDPDGVTNFGPTTSDETTVEIKVTVGDVINKYAVDIEFTDLTVNVSGSALTWNVNDLQYDASEFTAPDPATTKSTVKFSNRSDLPVKVSYAMIDADNNDLLSVEVTNSESAVIAAGDKQTIAKATPKSTGVAGSTTDYVFNLALIANDGLNATANEAADWQAVANYYAAYFANSPAGSVRTIATLTFTVEKG